MVLEGSGGAGSDLVLVGMLEMWGCGFPMACEILPTCWKLSRGSQWCQKALPSPAEDTVGQALAAVLLVAVFFPLSWHFGTRAVPGMVKMPGHSCGGWYGLGKTPSSRCNAVCLDLWFSIGFFGVISIFCLHQAPDLSQPGSCQRWKGWSAQDVLLVSKPTMFVLD